MTFPYPRESSKGKPGKYHFLISIAILGIMAWFALTVVFPHIYTSINTTIENQSNFTNVAIVEPLPCIPHAVKFEFLEVPSDAEIYEGYFKTKMNVSPLVGENVTISGPNITLHEKTDDNGSITVFLCSYYVHRITTDSMGRSVYPVQNDYKIFVLNSSIKR